MSFDSLLSIDDLHSVERTVFKLGDLCKFHFSESTLAQSFSHGQIIHRLDSQYFLTGVMLDVLLNLSHQVFGKIIQNTFHLLLRLFLLDTAHLY